MNIIRKTNNTLARSTKWSPLGFSLSTPSIKISTFQVQVKIKLLLRIWKFFLSYFIDKFVVFHKVNFKSYSWFANRKIVQNDVNYVQEALKSLIKCILNNFSYWSIENVCHWTSLLLFKIFNPHFKRNIVTLGPS